MKDEVDRDRDDALATFVINSHMKNHPKIIKAKASMQEEAVDNETKQKLVKEMEEIDAHLSANLLPDRLKMKDEANLIPYDLLKKYLIYAKRFHRPKLQKLD